MNKETIDRAKDGWYKKGEINEDLLTLMFEYYKHMVEKDKRPVLVSDTQHFRYCLEKFLATPVFRNNIPFKNTINRGVEDVFEYFDGINKKY